MSGFFYPRSPRSLRNPPCLPSQRLSISTLFLCYMVQDAFRRCQVRNVNNGLGLPELDILLLERTSRRSIYSYLCGHMWNSAYDLYKPPEMHSWTPSSSAVTVGLQQVIGRSSCYWNHCFYWLMPGTAIDHALSQQQAVQEGLPLRINPNPYQPPIKTSWRGRKSKKRKKKKRKRKSPNILLNPRFLPRCDGMLRGTFACKYGGKKITDKKRKPILDSKRGGREGKKKRKNPRNGQQKEGKRRLWYG